MEVPAPGSPEAFQKILDECNLDELNALAGWAETAEKFDDMSAVMVEIVKRKKDDPEGMIVIEETLMSVAFKNVVGDLRKQYRKMGAASLDGDFHPDSIPHRLRTQIKTEVTDKCSSVIDLLNKYLVDDKFVTSHNEKFQACKAKYMKDNNIAENEESKINEAELQKIFQASWDDKKLARKLESQTYYYKMLGDYWRYASEAEKTDKSVDSAGSAYTKAWEMAKSFMLPTHPTRLGLALNSSVFIQEIKGDSQRAQQVASEAFDSAIQSLDTLNNTSYKDSTLIMQLLRDNLTIWQQQNDDNEDKKVD